VRSLWEVFIEPGSAATMWLADNDAQTQGLRTAVAVEYLMGSNPILRYQQMPTLALSDSVAAIARPHSCTFFVTRHAPRRRANDGS